MDRSSDSHAIRGLILVAAAALLWSGAVAALSATVEVTDVEVGATRACGSPFDAISGRSGWEAWWARDLDESDTAVRERLVRTSQCPSAVNRSTVAATTFGGLGSLSALVAWLTLRRRRSPARAAPAARLARLGWATAACGGVLSVAGMAATALLLADPDAPLFLYTSRSVAAAVALIMLTPALALIAGGGALVLAADVLAGRGDGHER